LSHQTLLVSHRLLLSETGPDRENGRMDAPRYRARFPKLPLDIS
jgi:hypothetical protein